MDVVRQCRGSAGGFRSRGTSRHPVERVVIDEAVLLRPFGSIGATINQLQYLRSLTEAGTLQLQVIPCDGRIAHRGEPRFELLEFDHPDALPIVVSHLIGYRPESLYDPAGVEH